jgi:glutamate-1-semialdehyde 2,1-aminomutase
MKTVAIIQARISSTRLSGKVLLDLAGIEVLAWVVRAAKSIVGVDEVVVATSTEDNEIADWCAKNNVTCSQGSLEDVLERFATAARSSKADVVIRLTGDCPLLDPAVCGAVLRLFKTGNYDYASNVSPPTWPDGLDCEVFNAKALFTAEKEAKLKSEREHVTPFIYHNQYRFKVANLTCPIQNLSKERWTLDNPEDYEFLKKVTANLAENRAPSYLEVLEILDKNPKLREINKQIKRNEGLDKTIKAQAIPRITKFDNSIAMLKRAEKTVPLGSQTFSKSKLQYPEGKSPLFITHGQGARVWDVDGNEYVDLISALLPVVLGYNDPDINYAIRNQLDKGITFSLATELEAQLSEKLVEIIPCAEKVRFGKNGSDVTTAAIRVARAFTGRDKIIVCGYHGWHDWYIGSTTRSKGVPEAVQGLTAKVPYNDLAAVEDLLKKNPDTFAGLIMEPMNVAEPNENYLKELKALLHKHGALLIFDEVITGFRYALGGAQELFGVTPDLASFGKALGNGMPISALAGRADVMDVIEEIFFSGTFGGEALSIAAAIALIDKMQREPVLENIWATGKHIRGSVNSLLNDYGLQDIISLKGKDCWTIMNVNKHENASAEAIKTLFIREMVANGVLTIGSNNVNYAHNDTDMQHILYAYNNSFEKIADALKKQNIETELEGKILQPVFKVR